MAIKIGKQTVVIQGNELVELGGTNAVKLFCETVGNEPESIDVVIWITEKSAGIARASLKICGFNVDEEDFQVLSDNRDRLKGKEISVLVEERGSRLRAQIILNTTPTKKRITEIQGLLRDVKKGNPAGSKDEDLPF